MIYFFIATKFLQFLNVNDPISNIEILKTFMLKSVKLYTIQLQFQNLEDFKNLKLIFLNFRDFNLFLFQILI